jgi:hypothetical protein
LNKLTQAYGTTISGAVEQAMNNLANDPRFSAPALWRGFVVVGDGRAGAGRVRKPGIKMASNPIILALAALIAVTSLRAPTTAQQTKEEISQELEIIKDESVDVDTRIDSINSVLAALDRNAPRERITWAALEGHKGFLLFKATKGTREENIETSIESVREALTVFTPESYPEPWARTQNNLGISYRNRIRGDPVDNALKAITTYEAALTVYTPEKYPQLNAVTLTNMRIAQTRVGSRSWGPAAEVDSHIKSRGRPDLTNMRHPGSRGSKAQLASPDPRRSTFARRPLGKEVRFVPFVRRSHPAATPAL